MIYDLRCVFEYVSKPVWRSQWNRTGDIASDAAYMQTKTGLLFAVIEGKNIITREIVRLAEYPGGDFCNFQWVAASFVPLNGTSGKLNSRLLGLAMITRNNIITVFKDGTIKIDPRDGNKDDKFMHYAREKL